MSVEHPLRLAVALAAALLAIAGFVALLRARRGAALAYSNLAFMHAVAAPPAWLLRLLAAAGIAGVLAIATATASPHVVVPVPVRDGSVVLCIDTSGSMASTDVAPTRYAAAQAAARAFIEATVPGTRIGIVAFAGGASVVAPLQSDRVQVAASLALLPPPNGPTAIGDALALAARMLPRSGHRVAIVVTDGVNNTGTDPLAQAQLLGASGIRIFTIGIGTENGGPIPGTGETAGIDEAALGAYAKAGGGAYARAGSASSLRDALAHLGRVASLQRRSVDVSLAVAIFGGLAILAAAAGGFALGRFP